MEEPQPANVAHNVPHNVPDTVRQRTSSTPDPPRLAAAHRQGVTGLDLLQQQYRRTPYLTFLSAGLTITALVFIFLNERWAVSMSRSYDECREHVTSLPVCDVIDTTLEGKLVHVSGALRTSPVLTDEMFGIAISAVKLKRRVQMLQWVEETSEPATDDPSEHHTSPSYERAWRDKLVDSSGFSELEGHENPTSIPVLPLTTHSRTVAVGAYNLPQDLPIFDKFTPFSGDSEPPSPLPGYRLRMHGGLYQLSSAPGGPDMFSPRVGDVRVQYYLAGHQGDTYSCVGVLNGSHLTHYDSSNGQSLLLVNRGQRSAEEVVSHHTSHTRVWVWMWRVGASCGACVALWLAEDVWRAAVCQVSVMRDVAVMPGPKFALTVASGICLATVAVAWVVYRPLMAAVLVLVASAPVISGGTRRLRATV